MNRKTVYLILAIISITSLFTSTTIIYADVLAPQKQQSLDISIEKIICKENYIKVENTKAKRVACVKPATAEKLIKNGWAKPVESKIIEQVKMRTAIGEVKKISVVKEAGSSARLDTSPGIAGYNFAFEVCAKDRTIRLPQVLIESDSQVKTITLIDKVDANKCQVSAAKIKASDPVTIKASLTNKGGISERIISLENKVEDLRTKLAAEKLALSEMQELPKDANFDKKTDEIATKIKQLRTELNSVREELNRFTFFFYAQPAKITEYRQPLSFTGESIVGASAKKISVSPQISGEGYNVVFEACAGQTIVRAPIVNVKSDTDNASIKLADKISPNSCQMGTAKLGANTLESITVNFANTAKASNQVDDSEKRISNLKQQAADTKQELEELARLAPDKRPPGSDEKITELTNKLVDLRNEINDLKEQLARLLYNVYK